MVNMFESSNTGGATTPDAPSGDQTGPSRPHLLSWTPDLGPLAKV